MKLSDLQKLQASVILGHLGALAGLILCWEPAWLGLSLATHLAFLWLGHDLYHHRYLSHRSFEMPVWLQRICAVLGIYCLFGTPIGIAATHVLHHRHADTDADPHPAREGWRAWCWTYSSIKMRDRVTVARLSADPWLRFISKHYFKIYFSTVFLACAVNPRLAIYGFLVPAVYAFFSNGLVNVVCHRWGYRRYATPDQSRNNLIVNVALFFGGIALHNTHHSNPKACYLSRAWYEIDLVGCIANAIHRHTLATKES